MSWGGGIRRLIKVTSECFIPSHPTSQTGNSLRGFAERRSQATGKDRHSDVCFNISLRQGGPQGPAFPYKSPPERQHNKVHLAKCNIPLGDFPEKLDSSVKEMESYLL